MPGRTDPFADNPALEFLTGVSDTSAPKAVEPPAVEEVVEQPVVKKPRQSRQIKRESASTVKAVSTEVPARKPYRKAQGRISLSFPEELLRRVDNACYWTPGLNKTKFLTRAMEAALAKLEKRNGGPFDDIPEDDL